MLRLLTEWSEVMTHLTIAEVDFLEVEERFSHERRAEFGQCNPNDILWRWKNF